MDALWSGEEFVEAAGGRPIGDMPATIPGVSIDTRTLAPGEAFFAIAGDRFDGHDFATQAMTAGAGCIVIAENKVIALGHLQVPKVVVPDVLGALENVGAAARERTRAGVIGVTGSVGKTTTKEMLRAALSGAGEVHAAVRSFNNHWGVPLTLARLPRRANFGVFEIGMNAPGEILPLARQVRPHVAIVTRIAPAHLGAFEDEAGIADEKGTIFRALEPGGTAILNADDPHRERLAAMIPAGCSRRSFGETSNADVRLAASGEGARVAIDGEAFDLALRVPGRHNLLNACAALAAATAAGVEPRVAIEGLSRMEPVSGRGTRESVRFEGGTITLIDESYNANPVSMTAALDLLRESDAGGRRVAMLGDMRELGTHSREMHAGLADAVEASGAELVLLVGDEMTALADALQGRVEVYHRPTVEAAEPVAVAALRPGDTIMVKASNGTGLGRFVASLRERANG